MQLGVGSGQARQWPQRIISGQPHYHLPYAITIDGEVLTVGYQAVTLQDPFALTLNGKPLAVGGEGVTLGA